MVKTSYLSYAGVKTKIVGRVEVDKAASCRHFGCIPPFDEKAAIGLDDREARKRWPRFHGVCLECGESLIAYASESHYILGDW